MGMGFGANFAVVIQPAQIKKVVPMEWKSFADFLDERSVSFDDFAAALEYDDFLENLSEEENILIENKWNSVRNAFVEETQIELMLQYHSREDQGSRYDEVDGAVFNLAFRDVYEETPMAKKLRDSGTEFDIQYWVSLG